MSKDTIPPKGKKDKPVKDGWEWICRTRRWNKALGRYEYAHERGLKAFCFFVPVTAPAQ